MKTQTLCFRHSGKSIIGSSWSGEKDPTKIVEGGPRHPKGISGILRPEDSDCSGNNVFASYGNLSMSDRHKGGT
jgi:hypothetical protein